MKTKTLISFFMAAVMLVAACKKDKDDEQEDNTSKTGTLKFKTLNPLTQGKGFKSFLNHIKTNPALTGDSTATYTISFLVGIGDVWVSQGIVQAGQPDNLDWVRLTSTTNTELKMFEDYTFGAVDIPAGVYNSIKITLRNIFYRYLVLVSDSSVSYELLETMGSWTSPCDVNDTSWARTNYFGPDGNHSLDSTGLFYVTSANEKLAGFTIEAGKTANVTWRLGAGATEPCIAYLIDENSNLQWDCGVDRMEFVCPPENIYMWDFVVTYE